MRLASVVLKFLLQPIEILNATLPPTKPATARGSQPNRPVPVENAAAIRNHNTKSGSDCSADKHIRVRDHEIPSARALKVEQNSSARDVEY